MKTMMDMNGDGIVDMVDAATPGNWNVYFGQKSGAFSDTATPWQVPTGDVVPENGIAAIRKTWQPTNVNEKRTTADTFDITGDGIPDYVVACTGIAGDPSLDCDNGDIWHVYPGTPPNGTLGWGFGPMVEWPSPAACRYLDDIPGHGPRACYIRTDRIDPSQQGSTLTFTIHDMIDVNADGRPDLVIGPGGQTTSPPYSWLVYLNEGNGFSDSPLFDGFSAPSQWISVASTTAGGSHGFVTQQVADFNGDGLPDFLLSDTCQAGAGSCIRVYAGTGSGFMTAAVESPLYGGSLREWVYDYDTKTDLLDINGDGLPDRVALASFSHQSDMETSRWLVILNRGGRFGTCTGVFGARLKTTPRTTWSTSTAMAYSTASV